LWPPVQFSQAAHLVCEGSGQPHLKSSPVAVQRLSFGEPEPWLQARRAELNGESIEPFAARKFGGTVSRTVHTKV
jgi:hypothetical protein